MDPKKIKTERNTLVLSKSDQVTSSAQHSKLSDVVVLLPTFLNNKMTSLTGTTISAISSAMNAQNVLSSPSNMGFSLLEKSSGPVSNNLSTDYKARLFETPTLSPAQQKALSLFSSSNEMSAGGNQFEGHENFSSVLKTTAIDEAAAQIDTTDKKESFISDLNDSPVVEAAESGPDSGTSIDSSTVVSVGPGSSFIEFMKETCLTRCQNEMITDEESNVPLNDQQELSQLGTRSSSEKSSDSIISLTLSNSSDDPFEMEVDEVENEQEYDDVDNSDSNSIQNDTQSTASEDTSVTLQTVQKVTDIVNSSEQNESLLKTLQAETSQNVSAYQNISDERHSPIKMASGMKLVDKHSSGADSNDDVDEPQHGLQKTNKNGGSHPKQFTPVLIQTPNDKVKKKLDDAFNTDQTNTGTEHSGNECIYVSSDKNKNSNAKDSVEYIDSETDSNDEVTENISALGNLSNSDGKNLTMGILNTERPTPMFLFANKNNTNQLPSSKIVTKEADKNFTCSNIKNSDRKLQIAQSEIVTPYKSYTFSISPKKPNIVLVKPANAACTQTSICTSAGTQTPSMSIIANALHSKSLLTPLLDKLTPQSTQKPEPVISPTKATVKIPEDKSSETSCSMVNTNKSSNIYVSVNKNSVIIKSRTTEIQKSNTGTKLPNKPCETNEKIGLMSVFPKVMKPSPKITDNVAVKTSQAGIVTVKPVTSETQYTPNVVSNKTPASNQNNTGKILVKLGDKYVPYFKDMRYINKTLKDSVVCPSDKKINNTNFLNTPRTVNAPAPTQNIVNSSKQMQNPVFTKQSVSSSKMTQSHAGVPAEGSASTNLTTQNLKNQVFLIAPNTLNAGNTGTRLALNTTNINSSSYVFPVSNGQWPVVAQSATSALSKPSPNITNINSSSHVFPVSNGQLPVVAQSTPSAMTLLSLISLLPKTTLSSCAPTTVNVVQAKNVLSNTTLSSAPRAVDVAPFKSLLTNTSLSTPMRSAVPFSPINNASVAASQPAKYFVKLPPKSNEPISSISNSNTKNTYTFSTQSSSNSTDSKPSIVMTSTAAPQMKPSGEHKPEVHKGLQTILAQLNAPTLLNKINQNSDVKVSTGVNGAKSVYILPSQIYQEVSNICQQKVQTFPPYSKASLNLSTNTGGNDQKVTISPLKVKVFSSDGTKKETAIHNPTSGIVNKNVRQQRLQNTKVIQNAKRSTEALTNSLHHPPTSSSTECPATTSANTSTCDPPAMYIISNSLTDSSIKSKRTQGRGNYKSTTIDGKTVVSSAGTNEPLVISSENISISRPYSHNGQSMSSTEDSAVMMIPKDTMNTCQNNLKKPNDVSEKDKSTDLITENPYFVIDSVFSLQQNFESNDTVVSRRQNFSAGNAVVSHRRNSGPDHTVLPRQKIGLTEYFNYRFDLSVVNAGILRLDKIAKEDEGLRKPCFVVLEHTRDNVQEQRCSRRCRKKIVKRLCHRIYKKSLKNNIKYSKLEPALKSTKSQQKRNESSTSPTQRTSWTKSSSSISSVDASTKKPLSDDVERVLPEIKIASVNSNPAERKKDEFLMLNLAGKTVLIPTPNKSEQPKAYVIYGKPGENLSEAINYVRRQHMGRNRCNTGTSLLNISTSTTSGIVTTLSSVLSTSAPTMTSSIQSPIVSVKSEPASTGYCDEANQECSMVVKTEPVTPGYGEQNEDDGPTTSKVPRIDNVTTDETASDRIKRLKEELKAKEQELDEIRRKRAKDRLKACVMGIFQ